MKPFWRACAVTTLVMSCFYLGVFLGPCQTSMLLLWAVSLIAAIVLEIIVRLPK